MTSMGWWMEEGAGAGELVAEGSRAVARAWSLRGPATRLSEAFIQLTGARDADDLLEGITPEKYHLDAAAARAVFRVAGEGDALACQVIEWAGCELASLAIGVIGQLNFERLDFFAVLMGSLFDGGPLLSEPLFRAVSAVAPGVRFLRL
jgi:N-acetylglucosamine kinase-like BadF-type ATPase